MTADTSGDGPGSTEISHRPRIAGWMPSGLLDWPGRMAATVFISGCNLRCPFCHNPDLVVVSGGQDAHDALFEHLRSRKDWIDGVVVTGGEPTTDPSLFSLLDEFATLCLPVKLDTNGTDPETLATLIESGLIASVALDVKASPERYPEATGRTDDVWPAVHESIRVILGSGIHHEFRTTVCPSVVSAADLVEIAEAIEGGDRYVLQQFRPERTLSLEVKDVEPFSPDLLSTAAEKCSRYIPTTVRGA